MKAEKLINKNNKSENFEGTEREAKTSVTSATTNEAQNKNASHTKLLVSAEQKVNDLQLAQNNPQASLGNIGSKAGNAAGKVSKEKDFYSEYALTDEDLYFQEDEVYGAEQQQPAPEVNMAVGNSFANIDSGKLLVGGGIGLALIGGAIAMGGGGGGKGGGDSSKAPPSIKDAANPPMTPVLRDAQVNLKNKTLTAQADPGTKVFFYIKGEKIGEATADVKGNVSVNTDEIEDGSHAIYAVAQDAQGRQSKVSETKNIVFDRIAPTITFEGHESGYINAADRDNKKPLVAYTEPNATVELFDAEKKLLGTQTADASGKVSFNTEIITHGKKVFLKVTDAGGNQVTSKELIADYEVGDIKSYSLQYTETNKAYINGLSGEADKETKKIKLQFAGQTQWQEAQVINGKWAFTFEPAIKNTGQSYKLVVEDGAGNVGKTIEVTQIPAPVLKGYDSGYINAQNKKLTATTSPNVDVELVNAKNGEVLATEKSDASGAVVFDVNQFNGSKIFLQVKGSNGQQAVPTKALTIDVTPPPPVPKNNIEFIENPDVKGYVKQVQGELFTLLANGGKLVNEGDAKFVEITVNKKTYMAPVDANGKWSYEFAGTEVELKVRKNFKFKAIDEAGNESDVVGTYIPSPSLGFSISKVNVESSGEGANAKKTFFIEGTGKAGHQAFLGIVLFSDEWSKEQLQALGVVNVREDIDGTYYGILALGVFAEVGANGTFKGKTELSLDPKFKELIDYLMTTKKLTMSFAYLNESGKYIGEGLQDIDMKPPAPAKLKDALRTKTGIDDDVLTGPVEKLLQQKKSEEISPQKFNEAYEKNAEKNTTPFKSIQDQDPLNDFM